MIINLVVPVGDIPKGLGDLAQYATRPIVARWGGCTVLPAFGHWLDNDGVRVSEHVSVVRVGIGLEYHEENSDNDIIRWFRDLARDIARAMDQEAVYFEVIRKAEVYLEGR